MKTQSLNGTWSYRIGKGPETTQTVPFSTLAVGRSFCKRSFDLDQTKLSKDGKVFLVFDGITYHAWVTVNGTQVGDMLPYSEYRFDITDLVKDTDNELIVELEDINVPFGPTEGWENFGGIIRDVWLYYAADVHIADVFFKTTLLNDYKDADMTVDITLSSDTLSANCWLEVSLSRDGKTVLSYQETPGMSGASHRIENVDLWSPDTPALYQLTVTLMSPSGEKDSYTCNVGFREITCTRHRFLVNGQPVFFKGVCKHEMYDDFGHTITPEQIEKDMSMIKACGCNFVRLVHYPHDKKVVETADRLGLFISEEPGLWWSDTADPEVAAGSLEVLRRTILRDRNHPSVAFWLSFNECYFTEQFLIDSARVCKELDPTRLVSGANCMNNEDTLKYFNICGFDFYTMHPYSNTFERARTSAQILHDKPLLFTEWGGYFVTDNPHLMSDFMDEMTKLYEADSDEGALAGAFYWCWADVNDFNRGFPACKDGVLYEGLVTKDRKPNMIHKAFCDSLARMDVAPVTEADLYEYQALDAIPNGKTALTCNDQGGDLYELTKDGRSLTTKRYWIQRYRRIQTPPILLKEEIPGISLIPKVLTDDMVLTYHISDSCKDSCNNGTCASDLTILGLTCLSKGFPLHGTFEEAAAEVVLVCTDGEEITYELRNGRELTSAFTTIGSSRINPVADKASRFAEFSYRKDFEQYIMNRLDLSIPAGKIVKEVQIRSLNKGYLVLFYGLYL